ncbi:MAG: beta-galactosidase trimerization domain-containing protein, partial [Bryobacteraceae bacterium]
HSCREEAYQAHPEWVAVDADGKPRPHWATPGRWITCALGPYSFEFMTEVIREIMALYRVDGIFANRWSGSGMCYCEHCRRNFRDFCGLELPRTTDSQDRARRQYILWRQQRLFELWRLWDGEIRRINPNACFIPNTGGGALSELDMKTVGELAPTLMADRQARRGLMPPWANGKNAKEYRATLGRKPLVGIFSVGLEEPYRWKDSVQTEAEIRIWVADGVAHGMRPWFTKFCGIIHDPRWLKVVEQIYDWHWRQERYLRNEESLAQVALVYSQQTAAFYGGPRAQEKVEQHILGAYHALVEARIPFDMVHDGLLDSGRIARYRVLILPNVAALSDQQCQQLRTYVERGGGLVATFETSLYDEWGARRKDFGLADLFGASFQGRLEGPMRNAYLRLEHRTRHPLLRGLEAAPRIIHGVWRLEVRPRAQLTDAPVTLIPSYPDLPMEEVYPRVEKTGIPEAYLREFGRGRVAYFPWDLDRVFWEVMCADHGRLLANAVDWAASEERPVRVEGPGVLDVAYWRQQNSVTLHLVNLTNPMMMKGPYREAIPVGLQRVRLRLPQGSRVREVRLLVAGGSPEWKQRADWLELSVPSVGIHEVIAADL